MITQEAFDLFFREINQAHFLGFIPVHWNAKRQLVVETKSKPKMFLWKFHVVLVWIYYSFIISRFIGTIIFDEINYGRIITLIIHFLWCCMFSCVFFADLTFVLKRKEFVQMMNSLIVFNNRLREEAKAAGQKESADIVSKFFKFSSASIYGNPVTTAFLFLFNPCNPRFYASIIYSDCSRMSLMEMGAFFLVEVYYFTHAVFACYAIIFAIFLVQFGLMGALKFMIQKPLKKECCMLLRKQASVYRQIQILNIQFHDCVRNTFLPAVTISGAGCTIIPLTGLIKLHHVFGLAGNAGLPLLAFAGITVLMAIIFITGRCYRLSGVDLFEHWKKADLCCKTKWMKKFRHSCPIIKVWFGSFFTVDNRTVLGSAQFCVDQTATLILMF